ncbi:MAG: type II 3-dehydroquinate dehydratase [Candidatus Marinimicrobia bacterium]|nr:type II 3-dehydroquinate dehydratase [Candidatus Neomarinimicrobiota bacterium]
MNILVINGPNLNLLGTREPEVYGTETLGEIMNWLESTSEAIRHTFKFFQSNHEGEIIDTLHENMKWADGILINPAAFTHYSYAIRDAISAVGIPTVEVHLSDIQNREEFRKVSVIESVCIAQVSGLGKESYLEGLKKLIGGAIQT